MATNTGTTTGSTTGSTIGVTAITLVTDNHTGNTNTDQIVLRQSEAGQGLQVTLVHEDGTPYDLTNCLVTFSENKDDGKMVSDDNIQNINAKAGTFTYMFNQAVYQTSGTAWFDITDNTRKLIATTVNFSITITDQLDLPINNNSYWSAAQSLLTHISANMSKWQDDIDQSEANTTSQLNSLIKQFQDSLTQYSALMNTYDDKFASLQGSWQNQIDSLSENTAKQAAADFQTQRDALEDEFTDFEIQLKKDLSNKLLDLNDALTSLSETTVPQVNDSINTVAEEVKDLTKQLNAFDFSKYATHKDLAALSVQIDSMYTNSKIDSMLDAVGKVKTVNGQKPDGSGDVLVAAGKVKTVNGQGPDNNGNISIGTGKVQSVNGNMPNDDGDVQVPSYAPNLLMGTQSKPKTVDMGTWSANADTYSIDPSIDLSGQTVTASIKLAKSANDVRAVLGYTDSTGVVQLANGTVVPAGTTGYSTVTQVLPANVKNIVVMPTWTNGTVTGTCTYSEAKLAVWKSADLPPDMTWVPNEADKANAFDISNLQNQVNSKTSGTVVTAYDIASKTPTTVVSSYTSKELVDQGVLPQFADAINDIESGVINNTRTIRILSHDGNNLATHDNATIMAQTEYIKTDSTLSDYGAVANSGKVGEAIKQTFLILSTSLNQLVANYNSLQSNQVIVDLTNQVLALKDQVANKMDAAQVISQTDYDKLATKDPNTLYEITE